MYHKLNYGFVIRLKRGAEGRGPLGELASDLEVGQI